MLRNRDVIRRAVARGHSRDEAACLHPHCGQDALVWMSGRSERPIWANTAPHTCSLVAHDIGRFGMFLPAFE
jgi:hypothetical protein